MFEEVSRNLPVPSNARRNYFSLEMTPSGVSLRLEGATVNLPCGPVGVSGLALAVPLVTYPFDCQAGPRSLRSHLTVLDSVTLDIPFRTVAALGTTAFSSSGGEAISVESSSGGLMVLSGIRGSLPFSVRVGVKRGREHFVRVVAEHPRVFGLSDHPWSKISAIVIGASVTSGGDDSGTVDVLRQCLKPLMAGLGFKIPLMEGVVLDSATVAGESLRLFFKTDDIGRTAAAYQDNPVESSAAKPLSPTELLAGLSSSTDGDVVAFIEQGISSPVLWPEILARAVAMGSEHPEMVSPLLAAVLTGAENPGWISPEDLLRLCRRLLAAAEREGCRSETARCAGLVAGVVDMFEPRDALALLNEIRAGGFEGREILEAVGMTFNRLGRHLDASTTRLRAIAMVVPEASGDAVRSMVDRMDANGFGAQASSWLGELSALASSGRFGESSRSVNRAALILSASREAVSSGAAARDGLRRILEQNPGDPEVLELMLALAREKHEVAEVVDMFRAAADLASGKARCDLMLVAARAVYERFGLRRRAVELLEAGLEADPGCQEAAKLLDTLYMALGRPAERVELASRRLAACRGAGERAAILESMVGAALEAGMPDRAAEGVRALLKIDPSSLEYLRLGESVFSRSGDRGELREVQEAIEDLSAAAGMSLEDALAAGDPAAAVVRIRADLEAEQRPAERLELLLQAADLSLIAGAVPDAAGFLAAALALDPVVAVGAACRACASTAPDIPVALLDVVREGARTTMSVAQAREMAVMLLDSGSRLADRSMQAARLLLEIAMPLAPDEVSIQMALAATYESLGMKPEADALLGKD